MEIVILSVVTGFSFLMSLANLLITVKEIRAIKEQLELSSYKGFMLLNGQWIEIPAESLKAGKKLAELRQGYGLITSGLSDHILDRDSKKFYLFPKGAKVEIPNAAQK